MNTPETSVEKDDEVIEYVGAGVPKGNEQHCYIFLVLKQPNGRIQHNEPRSSNRWESTR